MNNKAKHAEQIAALLDSFETDDAAYLPILFVGDDIRRIGSATDISEVDSSLRRDGLSATYVSLAKLDNDPRRFFIAHG